jgi:predicted  nucleic acid-binding Zn-ribbon protein
LQVEFLQKYSQSGIKQRNRVVQLQQEKELLEYELGRIKNNFTEIEARAEEALQHERERGKGLHEHISKME